MSLLASLACLLAVATQQAANAQAQSNANPFGDRLFYEGPGVLPGQIMRARGFHTEDHFFFVSKDGYQIQLTRAWNPLLNGRHHASCGGKPRRPARSYQNRIPILFIHGILESFNVFVTNSFGAKPRNFGNASLGSISLTHARRRFAHEPSAKSLPLLALNHGHEVWLMSRRGFPGSQKQVGNPLEGVNGQTSAFPVTGPLTAFLGAITDYKRLVQQLNFSVSRKFWNFSLDEQAAFDLPQAVALVLRKSCRKQLSVVAHSIGGALTLMALSMYPNLNRNIQSAILWSEAFSLGRDDLTSVTRVSRSLLEKFVGAVPPTFNTDMLQAIFALFCTLPLTQLTLCESVGDLILGPSFGEAPLKAQFLNSLLYSSPSHVLAQMKQNADMGGQMHMFDYGRNANLAAYGRPKPPAYNLSSITLENLSFYEAETDFTVSVADVEATRRLLRVPNRRHLVPGPFNHQGYFFHKDNARLAVIPSLREIQQFSDEQARRAS